MTTRRAVRLVRLQEVLEETKVSRRALRVYEEIGLVLPSGKEGRTPLYTEDSIERIHRIQRLRQDLGVNLAGIQVILEMRRKLEELQDNLEEVVTFVRRDLRSELEQYLRRQEKAVVPRPLAGPPSPMGDKPKDG